MSNNPRPKTTRIRTISLAYKKAPTARNDELPKKQNIAYRMNIHSNQNHTELVRQQIKDWEIRKHIRAGIPSNVYRKQKTDNLLAEIRNSLRPEFSIIHEINKQVDGDRPEQQNKTREKTNLQPRMSKDYRLNGYHEYAWYTL